MRCPVFVLRPREASSRELLQSRLHADVTVAWGPDLPDPAEYDILVAGRPEREHLTASPNLRTLIIPWAGVPQTTRRLLDEFPRIAVHNLHYNARPVAELAMGLLLAAAKSILPLDRALRGGDWTPRYDSKRALLLRGRKALVLGYGAIGRQVAELCQAFGMQVIATRRRTGEPGCSRGVGIFDGSRETLHRLLPRADVLFVCLPHTGETKGWIAAQELALLPSHAILVNVGRGAIVDENSLYRALRTKKLFAAGLDVWYTYPKDEDERADTPPAAHPFYELENVVMSPHRGGLCVETEELRMAALAEMLNSAARGEPMPNSVDLGTGY